MCLLLSVIVSASVLSWYRNNFILSLLSTYLKIMIWHEINEMNAVMRSHDARGWKNHSPVSAVAQLLLQWWLLWWWLFLKRLYRVCVRENVSECAFSCCHFLCVSQSWWFRAAPWATREGAKEKVRKRKKRLLASKLNRRCLDEIVVPSVKIREFDPFAVHPAAKNDTSLNTRCQQIMKHSKWWTDFAMQWKKAQRERFGGKVLVRSALKQTQQKQRTTMSNSSLTIYTESFFFCPQRFCPLKAACTDVEERLLLHDKISLSKFDLKLPSQPPLTLFLYLDFFCIFVGSDIILC